MRVYFLSAQALTTATQTEVGRVDEPPNYKASDLLVGRVAAGITVDRGPRGANRLWRQPAPSSS